VDLLKKDVDAELEQRGALLDLQINIESEKARLAKAETELKARPRIDTVKRSIDGNPAMMEAARNSDGTSKDVLTLQMSNEEVNPVYQELDKQVATSRTQLAALERQRAQMTARKLDEPQLARLSAMYAKESQIDSLEMERDLAKKVYEQVANSYESARLLVAGRSSGLQILTRAIPPDKPESRKIPRNVLIRASQRLPVVVAAGAGSRQRRGAGVASVASGRRTRADMSKRALITGITGQDGSYLAELLLEKGYEVHGLVRRASTTNYWRIEHLLDRIHLHPADLLDQLSIIRVIEAVRPQELYNLAAMSFVPASWDQPMLTGEFNAQGVTRILEAVRQVDPSIRLYQASSSEMFGKVREIPQTELTPFYPRSPTACRRSSRTTSRSTTARATTCSRSRDPLQPRVAAARARVRDAQGDRRRRADQARSDRHAQSRQPRRAARLGLRRRLRAGDVADAAAGARRRLRHRHRREPFGPGTGGGGVRARRPRLEEARPHRSALPAAGGSRSPDRRSGEGAQGARLDAVGRLHGAGADDGRRGRRAAVARAAHSARRRSTLGFSRGHGGPVSLDPSARRDDSRVARRAFAGVRHEQRRAGARQRDRPEAFRFGERVRRGQDSFVRRRKSFWTRKS
jgi:hypothetical protein